MVEKQKKSKCEMISCVILNEIFLYDRSTGGRTCASNGKCYHVIRKMIAGSGISVIIGRRSSTRGNEMMRSKVI